jgi:hypothetical protein
VATRGAAGEQGAGMGKHQRVVIDVDDAGRGGDPLGDLVSVVHGRQTGAGLGADTRESSANASPAARSTGWLSLPPSQ